MAPLEGAFTLLAGSRPVPGSRGTFLVACHPHHGADVPLPDGTLVHRGDPIAEIHFWNRHIAQMTVRNAQAVTWRLAADMRADLRALALAMQENRLAGNAVALYGASPVAPAAQRLGFTVRPLPAGWRRTALSAWQLTLRRIFKPPAVQRDLPGSATMELWLSRERLFALYGPDARGKPGSPRDRAPRPRPQGTQGQR